jgi:SAM-dependent methyltransferase
MRRYFDGQHERDDWVVAKLNALPPGSRLLDAGAGSQKYRSYCQHLVYLAQDFGGVTQDAQEGFAGLKETYTYGKLDYEGNIWSIPAQDASFDAILCTEVFEHIPYPNETLKEFSRLLKPGGKLILTAPFASLRHMDPYFFYTGFSDRWYEHFLKEYGFRPREITPQGDYNRCVAVELFRTMRMGGLSRLWRIPLLLPALAYYYFASLRPTPQSVATLVSGYFVYAGKTAH